MARRVISIILFAALISGLLGYIIIFEAKTELVSNWWTDFSKQNEKLPLSPFHTRRVDSSQLIIRGANEVIFKDKRLFWSGQNAIASPVLSKTSIVKKFIITNGGNGYSDDVDATVIGAMAENIILGNVLTKNGKIIELDLIKGSRWNEEPLVFIKGDEEPYTGKIEKNFSNGQIMEEDSYLNGKLHGTSKRYKNSGIPVSAKDYVNGKKSGTHIYWYSKPIEPTDYIPEIGNDGNTLQTLWHHLQEQAKEKFKNNYPSKESNAWIVKNYRLEGGSFQVKQLEHWKDGLKNGLWEGFESDGKKKFKDEYELGTRIKHKNF
jgi:antitoxin component YwqK of YwqJK toxin-antitoxin module